MTFEPVVIVALFAAIIAADRRLKTAAQPLRLRLAEKGEEFLQLRNLPENARNHVEFLLEHAFGMRVFLITALVAIPVIAVVFVIWPKSIFSSTEKTMRQMDPSERASFIEVCRLHDRITLINHWILLPLVELEMVLLMPLAIIVRGVIRGRVPETGGRDSVISLIENKRTHFRLKHPHVVASSQ